MRTRMKTVLLVPALAWAIPNVVAGQACIGMPTADGQFAIAGAVGFADGGTSYGAGVTADLMGPVSLFGGYSLVTIDEIDENANQFGGGIAWELSVPSVSICPVAGASYTRWSDTSDGAEVSVTGTVIPVGLGIGRRLVAGDNLFVTLHAVPQFQHIRGTVKGSEGGVSLSFSDSANEFGADLGAKIGSAAFFAGGGVRLTTVEDSDPVFLLTLGLVVGGR